METMRPSVTLLMLPPVPEDRPARSRDVMRVLEGVRDERPMPVYRVPWFGHFGRVVTDRSRPDGGLILALVATFWAWAPLLDPSRSVWRTFDAPNHMVRTHLLAVMASQGEWFPRWFPQQFGGYGYPTLNFYASLTYYLTAALATLFPGGSALEGAYVTLLVVASVVVVTGTYALGWVLWRHGPAALLMAMSVAYGPYVLQTNLFVAGAAPHVLGLGLMAWLLTAIHELWRPVPGYAWSRRRSWWGTSASVALLLVTHGVSALIGGILASGWVAMLIWRQPDWRALARTTSAAVSGALLTAFSWFPALVETSFVQTERMQLGALNFRNWFIRWPGYQPPLWGLQERSPYTVGVPVDLHVAYSNILAGPMRLSLVQSVVLFGGLAYLTWRIWKRAGTARPGSPVIFPVAFGSVVAVVLYANQFDWAVPVWEAYPILQMIQMPTRLFGPIAFAVALVLGGTVAALPRSGRMTMVTTLLLAVLMVASGTASRTLFVGEAPYDTVSDAVVDDLEAREPGNTTSTNEFLPRSADFETWHEGEARGFWLYDRMFPDAGWVAGQVMPWSGQVGIHGVSQAGLSWVVDVSVLPDGDTGGGGVLAFHQLAFPGWRAWVDDRPVAIEAAPLIASQAISPGFILVAVPAGEHRVSVRFGADWARMIGTGVTSLVMLLSGLWIALPLGRGFSGWVRGGTGLALGLAALASVVTILAGTLSPDGNLASLVSPLRSVLVASIADLVLDGSATVTSPTGSELGPSRYVDVRPLPILAIDQPLRAAGVRERRWLFTHPPTTVSVDIDIPQEVAGRRTYLQVFLGMDPEMWEASLGDGVRYLVTAGPDVARMEPDGSASGERTTVLDEVFNPRAQGDQRRWVDMLVPLDRWAGEPIRLEFRTDARDEPSNDWAGWGEPVVVELDTLTAGRMVRSASRQAKVALGRG